MLFRAKSDQLRDVLTPRSQNQWRRTWPESGTRGPRRNAKPGQENEREWRERLACDRRVTVNVASNYKTQLVQAYTKAGRSPMATRQNS